MRQPVGRPGAFSSRHRALSGRQFDHIALDRRLAAEFRPCGHQPAALLDHVGAAVGFLGLVIKRMGQYHLDKLAPERLDELTALCSLNDLRRRRRPIGRPILDEKSLTRKEIQRLVELPM